jgi:putative ABC transport system permease protein
MIPIKYSIGNLTSRRVATALTIVGIGIVIAVMVSMMALYRGVIFATVSSGSPDALLVMREGAEAELSSWISKDAHRIIRALPGVSKDAKGEALVSPELVVLFKLPKFDNPKGSNVAVRGVTPAAFELRPYVKVVEGRMFKPGVNELIVSRRIRDRFRNTNVGDTFEFGPRRWTIVGVFDAEGTAFGSEIWADLGYLGQAQRRTEYSSILVKPADRAAMASIKAAIQADNRLKLQVKTERQYYEDQTRGLVGILVLVRIVTFFMIGGAILATMNAMFSAVASRGRELATLRALGFSRRTILVSMVLESSIITLAGGLVGLLLALPMRLLSTGTMNMQTFSEMTFNFRVDANVATTGLIITLVAGIIGGLLPAIAAARMPITRALREI